ncbi:MAG: HdeD family acid-resistance protein [Flavobacteriales bacterium]
MNRFLKSNAWLAASHGIVFLILGYNLLTSKSTSLQAPLTLFAILLILLGAIGLLFGIAQRKRSPNWWQISALAIIDLLIGIYILINTQGTTIIFVKLISVFAIATGFSLAYVAFKAVKFKVLIGINAAVSAGFGLMLFFNPEMGSLDFLTLVGLYTLILGMFFCYMAWWMFNRKTEVIQSKADNSSKND